MAGGGQSHISRSGSARARSKSSHSQNKSHLVISSSANGAGSSSMIGIGLDDVRSGAASEKYILTPVSSQGGMMFSTGDNVGLYNHAQI